MLRVCAKAAALALRRPARAWLMVRMASWVVVLSLLVKLLSLSRALRIVSPEVREQRPAEAIDTLKLSTAIDSVLAVDFLMFKPSCWKRAAVLHRYLALAGVATTIQFGVTKDEGELKGHAWLELNGEPILENAAPNYKVTYTFPSAQAFEIDLAKIAELEN